MRRVLALAVVVAVIAIVANAHHSGPSSPPVQTVSAGIAGTSGSHTIPKTFSGFSTDGSAQDYADSRFVPAVQSLAPENLRGFPSGTGSNYFNWSTGQFFIPGAGHPFVEPGMPSPPDQLSLFVKAVQATKATPIFTLNVMTYCPADPSNPVNTDQAAPSCSKEQACGPDVASYQQECTNPDLTWGLPFELRLLQTAKAMGVPIKFVELGNELYGNGDYSYFFPTVQSYIAKMNVWISAIKAQFPNVKIGVVGFSANDCHAKPYTAPDVLARENGWNAAVIDGVVGETALTFHTYYESGIRTPGSVRNAGDLATMLSSAAQSCITAFQKQALDTLPNRLQAWVTEWNLYPTEQVLEYGSWAQGLTESIFAMELARQPEVTLIDNEALVNNQIYGALLSGATPRYVTSTTNKKVLVPGGSPPRVQPFALSGGGWAMYTLNRSLHGATSTATIEFSDPPPVAGTTAAGLQGQTFTVGGKTNLVLVNLSGDDVTLNLGTLSGHYSMSQHWASSGTFVTKTSSVHSSSGTVTGTVTLKPYSMTSLTS